MSFNYGREEKKWRLWKEAEEKELRDLGVDEETIEKLHNYDWAVFNSDRRYYRRLKEVGVAYSYSMAYIGLWENLECLWYLLLSL